MKSKPLTNANIESAAPGDVLRDSVVPGLHLRVFADSKSFYLRYRPKGGAERKPKLGELGVLTIVQARTVAREILMQAAAGKDPRVISASKKTLADVWARYEREHLPRKKEASRYADRRLWNTCLAPKLGRLAAADIDYDRVHQIHTGLADTPTQANRAVMLLSTMLGLAERWKMRPLNSNPCRLVSKFPETRRKRYMTPAEAARISAALDKRDDRRAGGVAFIRLLMLTGARCGDIAGAKWADLQGRALRLPDSKTGEATIHLSDEALEVIAALPKGKPGDRIVGIVSPKKLWDAVRAEAGCPDLRLHDLRHSFASAALSAGVSLSQIGELLNHASPLTTKRYAHLAEDHAQRAAGLASGAIASMLRAPAAPGSTPPPPTLQPALAERDALQ